MFWYMLNKTLCVTLTSNPWEGCLRQRQNACLLSAIELNWLIHRTERDSSISSTFAFIMRVLSGLVRCRWEMGGSCRSLSIKSFSQRISNNSKPQWHQNKRMHWLSKALVLHQSALHHRKHPKTIDYSLTYWYININTFLGLMPSRWSQSGGCLTGALWCYFPILYFTRHDNNPRGCDLMM